jgi:uncharacterized protein (TIGR02265 family)
MRGTDFFTPELRAQRLASIAPTDTLRGFFFHSALRAVRLMGDEALLARCVEASGEENFLSFFNYPARSFFQLIDTAAMALSARYGDFPEAVRYLGAQFTPDFLMSTTGRTLLLLSGGSPKLLLSAIPSTWVATMNHGRCWVEWEPGLMSGTLVIRGNAIPFTYYEGAIQKAVELTRLRGVTVQGRQVGLLDCEVYISW